ncbi:hypothetical protein KY317_00280 [Candidatus Woesearchaeota archaeon]|nr:hypothetical protein [Candidatus Woesearchaeota archaeon]
MIDKDDMLSILNQFQEQCKEAVKIARKAKIRIKGRITNIVLCGVGCSGTAAGAAKALEKKIPISVIKDYKTPSYVDKNSLVFILTCSGTAEETQSCYADAKRKKANIVVVTSNEKFAKKEKNTILIPGGILPRLSFGYMFLPIVVVLQKYRLIPNQDFAEALRIIVPKICSREGFMISKLLRNKMLLIYSSPDFEAIAYRIKLMVNENAKQAAFANTIPEISYSEIISLKKQTKKFQILLITDSADHPQIKKRMEVLKKIIRKKANVTEFPIKGKSLLAKLLYSVYVGDYLSYYLALMYKEDPTPTGLIEDFKEKMKQR